MADPRASDPGGTQPPHAAMQTPSGMSMLTPPSHRADKYIRRRSLSSSVLNLRGSSSVPENKLESAALAPKSEGMGPRRQLRSSSGTFHFASQRSIPTISSTQRSPSLTTLCPRRSEADLLLDTMLGGSMHKLEFETVDLGGDGDNDDTSQNNNNMYILTEGDSVAYGAGESFENASIAEGSPESLPKGSSPQKWKGILSTFGIGRRIPEAPDQAHLSKKLSRSDPEYLAGRRGVSVSGADSMLSSMASITTEAKVWVVGG